MNRSVVVQPSLGYHITNSQSQHITLARLKSGMYSSCICGGRGRFCPLFLFSTTRLHGGNQPDDGCCFFSRTPPKTDHFKYYYYTLITLLHSLRLRPLLLQTPTTRSSFFYRTEGTFPSTQLATLLNFKSPAGGDEVT